MDAGKRLTGAVGIFGGSGLYRLLEGNPGVPAVSAEEAFRVFADNLDKLRALLFRAVPTIGPQPDDSCATALSSAIVR